jgi:hypothetical protein
LGGFGCSNDDQSPGDDFTKEVGAGYLDVRWNWRMTSMVGMLTDAGAVQKWTSGAFWFLKKNSDPHE